MSGPTARELKIMLENVIEKIDDGFELNTKEHNSLVDHAKETNGNVKKNTEFRVATEAQLRVWKWIISFVGVSNLFLLANAII
jgi:hypothetical protein